MNSLRNIWIRIFPAGLLLFLLLIAGCAKQKEPEVSLLNGRFMTTNVDISPGGILKFKWIAEKGQADLESFTIRVNGTDLGGFPKVSLDPDMYFDSTYLEGPISEGDYTYAFIATDMDGNIGDKVIVVSVE